MSKDVQPEATSTKTWFGLAVAAAALAVSCVLPEAEVDPSLDTADASAGHGGTGAGGSSASSGAAGDDASAGTAGVAGFGGLDGSAGTGGSAGSGGAAGAADAGEAGPCPGTGGPVMVMLPQGYCIDSTEVTRGQYEAWLATKPGLDLQHPACAGWSTDYAPDPTCMAEDEVFKGPGWEDHPQVCIDWCDAYAYCKGVGKRLCGHIGGGPVALGDFADATKDQWYNACSSGGLHNYPYGGVPTVDGSDGYDSTKCADDVEVYGTVAVGSDTGCQSSESGYSGVYDLSGNVLEWEDSCDGTSDKWDFCRQRGGSYMFAGTALQCGAGEQGERPNTHPDIGFRCCGP